MYQVTIVKKIDDVPREAWDAMVLDNPYMLWGWQKTAEQTYRGNPDPHYFLLWDGEKLIGGAVCAIIEHVENVGSIENTIFGRAKNLFRKCGIGLLPFFDCSPLQARGTHILLAPDLDNEAQKRALAQMLQEIEKQAKKAKLPIAFTGLTDKQAQLIRALKHKGYCQTLGHPIGYLDILWDSFEGYRKDERFLSKNTRRNIRTQMNRNRNQGVVIRFIENASEFGNRFHELSDQNCRRHNKIPFAFREDFFQKLKDNLGENVHLSIAEKNDHVIGSHVLLIRNGYGNPCYVGVDHELAGNDFTYFNLAYYSTINHAIETKMKRLDFGNGMYDVKIDRGCYVTYTYIFYKPKYWVQKLLLMPWFWFQSFWYKQKLSPKVKKRVRSIS